LLIKYIKSVLWRVAKCLSYTEEARCLKVNQSRSINILFIFPSANQVRLSRFWSLRLPSALTTSSCHSSYSDSDVQMRKRLAGLSTVHVLCRRCSDVTTSCPGLGAKDITAVSLA